MDKGISKIGWGEQVVKKQFGLSAVALLMLVGVSGCGSTSAGPGTNNAGSTAGGGANTSAQASTSGGSGSSNTLVVYSAGPKNLAKGLVADFEKQTGIKVELFQSTTGKVLGRLQAEKSNPKADVVALADWSAGDALRNQGMLLAFHPTNESDLIWQDPGSTYFGYSASALGITYNTKLVKNPPHTWADVLNSEWNGKVVMPDPAQSGSAVDFVGGYLQTHGNSWSYFNSLQKNGAVVQGANAVALNQVITGSKDMVLAGVDYMAYADIAKGEPLGIVYPQGGTVVNPRPIMILKSSQHVQNTEKFIDFVLSKAGQKVVSKDYLLPGVKGAAANPKRASLAQIQSWSVNWTALASQKAEVIKHVDNLLQ